MEVAAIQSKLFLDALNFGVSGLVVADVQLTTNHIGNEDCQGLGCTACGPNWTCKMNRNKLRTVDVVEQAHLADAFQRRHKHRFGQDSKTDSKTDINRLLKVVALFTEASCDGLCDDDRRRFTIVLVQQSTDIVSDFVSVQMFNQKFFCSPCQIGGTGNFDPVFVVEAELPGLFCDTIGVVSALIEPLMVSDHLLLQTLQIKTKKRVAFPHICGLLGLGHVHSPVLHHDPLSSTRCPPMEQSCEWFGKGKFMS